MKVRIDGIGVVHIDESGGASFDADETLANVKQALDTKFVEIRELAGSVKNSIGEYWDELSAEDKVALSTSTLPGIGDATGLYADAAMYIRDPDSRNWLNYAITAASVLPVIPAASQLRNATEEGVKRFKLNVLHNTDAIKLGAIEEMGGMPVPSLAVTSQDLPFDGFGDVTLVGNPKNFNPARANNLAYSADAYTRRAPRYLRIAKKDAAKRFEGRYPEKEPYGLSSDLNDLSKKSNVDSHTYGKIESFYEFDKSAYSKFMEDANINLPDGVPAEDTAYWVRQNKPDEYAQWVSSEMDDLFEPERLFVTNPDRDYYTASGYRTKPTLKEYNAENVARWMRRNGAGRNTEGGMSSSGFGAMRASTTERLNSFDEMRDMAGNLTDSAAIDALKNAQESQFFDITDKLKPYYKYEANSIQYIDEVSELVRESERKGIDRAFAEIGFENVPDELRGEIDAFKNNLRQAPTEYFEVKPQRVVGMGEFGGAIVPHDLNQSALDFLKANDVQVETYTTPEQRKELRKKFAELAFGVGGVGIGATAYLGNQLDQTE